MFQPLWLALVALQYYKLATRMANSVERALPPLDLTGSSSQVAERWRQWKRSYQYYIDGKGITNASRKRAQLLHLAGMEVQDMYEDLPDPGPVNAAEDNEYVVCLRKLDAHFRAEDNVPYERHVFRQLAPTQGETADKFMVHLRKQARHCNFGEALEENLRDQLIEKLPNVELKKKLLEVNNITLEAAMEKVRKWEASREQASQMVTPSQEPGAGTNVVEESSGHGSKGKGVCFNCGKGGHFAQDRNCPARGRKCSKCGKYGHYASCCKGGRNPKFGKQSTTQRRGGRQQHRGKGGQANAVEGPFEHPGEDDTFAFTIEEQTCALSTSAEPVISVSIGGVSRDMLIDSGSASNLISMDTVQELKYHGLKIEVQPCTKKLYAYGGRELEVEGQFQSEVSVAKTKIVADFIVVKIGRCLLGYSTATDLGILRVDPSGTLGTGNCNTVNDTLVGQLKAKYPGVFHGIGKLKGYQLKLHVDPSVTPVVQKMRRVPFSLKDKVTTKVNELLEKDIIEKVEGPTAWVSPVVVVPKASGDIRLRVDMRRANEAIIRERLPIPTIDEVLESLNGSAVFSKLDLRWGFHQIELDADSRDITAFATHDRILQYKRLSFGVNAAPEKYQHIITQSMAGLPGVANIADDLIVHGRDTEEHDKNLNSVLERLSEKQLTVNAEKCTFRMNKVVFMGLLLSKHGVGPTEEKVRAVVEASQPQTPSEVRSFLGLVGFSARFIPDFATTADPLRRLARKGEPFKWGEEQEKSFQKLKGQVASAPVLAYFDKDMHTRVIADASPVGLGAVLVQEKNGESRAVCYASRSLSQVERRYSQTEKEALALVWACERFHLYLYGLPQFDLVTDHEALKVIYSRKSKPSARIERWVLRLQPYNYDVSYVPSRKNIADALSRLTKIPASDQSLQDDGYVRLVALHAVPTALRIKEIERVSAQDSELQAVRNCLIEEKWDNAPKSYLPVRNELTFIGHVILRGTRIVVPQALRKRVVSLAHEGHQGVVKTKERLRTKVWWPGMDRDAERRCAECYGCQLVTKNVPPPPVKPTMLPKQPWEEVAVDLMGPLPSREHLLVLVDYFSRWMEVDVIRTTSSETIIHCLDAQFARHGLPRGLRTDNGSNLVSREIEEYLKEMGIEHHYTTPLWPRANGEVERQNRSLLKSVRAAHAEGKNWREELNRFLLAYRSTPHSTTGKSLAELLFRRRLTTKMPELVDVEEEEIEVSDQGVRDRDTQRNQSNKDYVDKRFHARDRNVREGDTVLLKKKKENKLSPCYEKEPYEVMSRYGDQVVLRSPQGVQYKRNLQHIKPFNMPDQEEQGTALQDAEPRTEPKTTEIPPMKENPVPMAESPPEVEPTAVPTAEQPLRRSGRITSRPKLLNDYVLC